MSDRNEGIIRLAEQRVVWENELGAGWSFELEELVAIGELIDDDGISISRFAHRVVFVTRALQCFDVWICTAGLTFLTRDIQTVLGHGEIKFELTDTLRRSRIAWPQELVDGPLFVEIHVPPRTLLQRVASVFAGFFRTDLSPALLRYVSEATSPNRANPRP